MIDVRDISKRRGEAVALDRVSLRVPRGTIHGLIGADGAGKSTLFDILVALLRPDGGEARVGGCDVVQQWREVRRSVGYMPAAFSLYGDLSVRENLAFFARIYRKPVDGIEQLAGEIWRQLEPFATRAAAKLSGGMKQKLALCCALVHDPEVLMLDEPTTGVDPISRREFWDALRRLAEGGKTVLVSTSYMDEAARCDAITLLHRGRVLDTLAPGDVAGRYRGTLYEIEISGGRASAAKVLGTLREWSLCRECYTFGDRLHLGLTLDGIHPETVVGYLRARGIETEQLGLDVRAVVPTVEDLFIQLTASDAAPAATETTVSEEE